MRRAAASRTVEIPIGKELGDEQELSCARIDTRGNQHCWRNDGGGSLVVSPDSWGGGAAVVAQHSMLPILTLMTTKDALGFPPRQWAESPLFRRRVNPIAIDEALATPSPRRRAS